MKHGALLGAELLMDVYIELLSGAQDAMFRDSNSVSNNGEDSTELFDRILKTAQSNTPFEAREFNFEDDEFQVRKDFIKKRIKESFWGYNS